VTAGNDELDISIIDKLSEFDRLLSTVDKFIQIHELLTQIDAQLREQRYLNVVTNLEAIHAVVSTVAMETELEASVMKVLQTEVCIARERLLYELGETWNQLFRWMIPVDSRRSRPLVASLDVARKPSEKSEIVTAMARVNMLNMRIRTFTERVLTHFVEPIVQFRSAVVQVIDEPTHKTLNVSVVGGVEKTLPVPPADAFQKLEQVLVFLHAALDGISVDSSPTGESQMTKPLMEHFGGLFSAKLFDRVYDSCILPSMPTSEGGAETWASFGAVMADTEKFQSTLSTLGFLPKSSETDDEICSVETLMDRLNNANAKFANVRSQELLRQAHRLMMSELSNSVRVCSERPIGSDRDCSSPAIADLESFVKSCREQAATSGLKLPACQIR